MISIIMQNGSLFAMHNDQTMSLRHYDHDIFYEDLPSKRLRYLMNEEGKIISVASTIEPEERKNPSTRLPNDIFLEH